MEEFEPSSKAWNREWKSSSQVRCLESGMEKFEPSSETWNREWRNSRQVRSLESEMKVFGAKFRRLESGMEEFEASSKLGFGNSMSWSHVPMLGNANGRVRANSKFGTWLESANGIRAKFRRLESGIEEFEASLKL